jgi:hypothetical protein
VAFAASCIHLGALPRTPLARAGQASPDEVAIEKQEVCIGSQVSSAGDMGDTLYYRAVRTRDGQLLVGYFAFFSEERPWGNNWLTWTFVPALLVDMFYSRALLVAPGIQRATSGKGDVEGVRVFYDVGEGGTLTADRAVADDGVHDDVQLSRSEVYALDQKRPTFYSDVWSHQLGGRGARSKDDLAYVRCYSGEHLRPLPDAIAREFDVDDRRRAPPAHVEAMGTPVGGETSVAVTARRATAKVE